MRTASEKGGEDGTQSIETGLASGKKEQMGEWEGSWRETGSGG